MGARDRRRVTDLVYGVLRDLRAVQAIAGDAHDDALTLCTVQALRAAQADVKALHALGAIKADDCAQRIAAFDAAALTPAVRGNVPDAVYADWIAQYGAHEAAALAAALQRAAPVDVRVNTLKTDRDGLQAALAQAGIEAVATPYSPLGLRLPGRVALQNTRPWREGWMEPQDEGSQLLAALVTARAGERVVDYCAGAGGKTLALAAAMSDQGELWALDLDGARLARLLPRLQRAGASCVQTRTVRAGDAWSRARLASFDAVLVDAPCSGTGTWRRQPDARLRIAPMATMTQRQLDILRAAAQLLRPGGRLVYATCSLMAQENDAVVDGFLAEVPGFRALDAGERLAAGGIDLPGPRLRLLPHCHGTDGFFAAILQRDP